MAVVFSTIYKKAIQLALSEGLPKACLTDYINQKIDNNRVPMEQLLDVYELAEKHLQAGFGLRQGNQLNSNDYGTLGLSWKTCLKAKHHTNTENPCRDFLSLNIVKKVSKGFQYKCLNA